MSVGTATRGGSVDTIHDYMEKLKEIGPEKALELVIAQTEATRAQAQAKEAEYRALAELKFDKDGRIVEANMAGLWRLATSYARSKIVPEQYRNNPDDCFIACQMAFRWKADPMMVMQCSYVVHGKPGIEGKLAIALINTSGKIKGRVEYEFTGEGKNRACTASAVDRETGKTVSSTVTWAMAEAEGWVSKSGSKWKTIPDVMFTYRSATFLVRQYFPEVLMGMRTIDEIQDTEEPARTRDGIRTLDDIAGDLERDVATSTEPTKVEPKSEVKQEPAVEFDLTGVTAKFQDAKSLGDVSKLRSELEAAGIPEAQQLAIDALEHEARERITSARQKR